MRLTDPEAVNLTQAPAWLEEMRRDWQGRIVTAIGGGHSLTVEDAVRAQWHSSRRDGRIIIINRGFEICKRANALYAADFRFWEAVPAAREFRALKITQDRTAAYKYPFLKYIEGIDRTTFCPLPGGIARCGNSGHQVLNLLAHLRPKRIVLLGYDLQLGPDGQTHWHGDHTHTCATNPSATRLRAWAESMSELSLHLRDLGIEVLNASRCSALDCWPKMALEDCYD